MYIHKKAPYLGFLSNSKEMLLMLSSEKEEKILESCKSFLERDSFTITELSSLIETLTSTFTGNKSGPLYCTTENWISGQKICLQFQKSYSTRC